MTILTKKGTGPVPARVKAGRPEGGQFIEGLHNDQGDQVLSASAPQSDPPTQIRPDGTKVWLDADGELHRDNGPAIEHPGGYKGYYIHGQKHRTDGPAIEHTDGHKAFYVHGQLHRTDGPAIAWPDGSVEFWVHGQRHNTGGPAVERADGTKEYWVDGEQFTEEQFNQLRPKS